MNQSIQTKKRAGFTLIELLVVITIIIILATVIVGIAQQAGDSVKYKQTRVAIAKLGVSLESYHLDHGVYPVGIVGSDNAGILFQELGGYTSTGTIDESVESYADYLNPPTASQTTTRHKMVSSINGTFKVVDAFKNPFNYQDAASSPGTTNNPDYDLWSEGKDTTIATDNENNW